VSRTLDIQLLFKLIRWRDTLLRHIRGHERAGFRSNRLFVLLPEQVQNFEAGEGNAAPRVTTNTRTLNNNLHNFQANFSNESDIASPQPVNSTVFADFDQPYFARSEIDEGNDMNTSSPSFPSFPLPSWDDLLNTTMDDDVLRQWTELGHSELECAFIESEAAKWETMSSLRADTDLDLPHCSNEGARSLIHPGCDSYPDAMHYQGRLPSFPAEPRQDISGLRRFDGKYGHGLICSFE
jgi:hypothetical protein